MKNSLDEGIDTCIATVLHRDNMNELDKLVELSKQLGTRFMHFNYIPTGRAKAHAELDLTPTQRYQVLETIGKEIVGLYMQKKEEEIACGKSDIKVDKFSAHAHSMQALQRNSRKDRVESLWWKLTMRRSKALRTSPTSWMDAVQDGCTAASNQTET